MHSELENGRDLLELQMKYNDTSGIKKKFKILLYFLSVLMLVILLHHFFTYTINKDILNNLDGELYYIKRVGLVNTLFKSDANLNNETLLYAHENEVNSNIADFYYDNTNNVYTFKAMDSDSEWVIFDIIEGEVCLSDKDSMRTIYINRYKKYDLKDESGSIYVDDKLVKKFYGIDGKFTGYVSLGLSPDGRYMIYHSSGFLTDYGYLFWNIISFGKIGDLLSNTYIMDLETLKSTKFIEFSEMQWIQ